MIASQEPAARVVFTRGAVRIDQGTAVIPRDAVAPDVSVISPGTELSRLAATRIGPDHPAGYMTVTCPVDPNGERLLAPVPHGAPVRRTDTRALVVPADARMEQVALARFQLMAALGLARISAAVDTARTPCVIGGGPVALGCVLELRRLGRVDLRVITRNHRFAAAELPGVVVSTTAELATGATDLVIDCTGRADLAVAVVAAGGLLGLLGTPDPDTVLPADVLHRRGLTVVGMHELARYDRERYQAAFDMVLAWAGSSVDEGLMRSWCRRIPGRRATEVYAELTGPNRPVEPLLLLDWTS